MIGGLPPPARVLPPERQPASKSRKVEFLSGLAPRGEPTSRTDTCFQPTQPFRQQYLKYIRIQSDVTINNAIDANVDVDPWIFGVGVGYKF
ncbi:MAG TPA: OmpW family outer membrane protein [Geminicoccaceae bacterium]|nr:OmpW family outer membrane protein [Geminicoccaceae bacterium]